MRLITLVALTILFTTLQNVQSQYYSSGADPASIKWRQIKSDNFKVIYPEEFEEGAKRFVAILDSLYAYGGYSLKHSPKPIPVVLHSHTAYSNGFVSWAPKRMEIYTMPHQDMFAQDWLEQLAIHEFRHVVQIDKLNTGFTKFLSVFFGQQAIGGVLGLYAPLWFLEGDAVVTETMLSSTGRGRKPAFEQEIRAQLLEKETYEYDKAYFGSYKNYVPNHYNMGYLMVAGAREKYGSEVWERALEETGRNSWSITPFNKGIRSVTGKNKTDLYSEVFETWKERWKQQDDSIKASDFVGVTQRNAAYINYLYPTMAGSKMIAEVSGPGEVPRLVEIEPKTGHLNTLTWFGSRLREPFSANSGKVVWTELEPHPRWENQQFSVIRVLDLTTLKQRKLTRHSRYSSPAISPDGQRIAAIHTSYDNKYAIHLLSADDGKVIEEVKTPENAYPMTPSWDEQGQQLVMVLLGQGGKSLSIYNTQSKEWKQITDADYAQIRLPRFIGDQIYFSGSWTGIENIYRINTNGTGLEKVTEARFGAAVASTGGNGEIIYQNYTSDGYQVVKAKLDDLQIKDFQPMEFPAEKQLKKMQVGEKGKPDFSQLPTDHYVSKPYSKWNLFNFHSWAPVYMNINDEKVFTGVSAMSQNLLGTTFISAGYKADKQYEREKYSLNVAYKAWWPVLDLEFKMGDVDVNGFVENEEEEFYYYFDSKQNHYLMDFEVQLPFNLSRKQFTRYIQPSVSFVMQQSDDVISSYNVNKSGIKQPLNKEKLIFEGLDIRSLDYGLFAYSLKRSSQRDIAPRWGQVLELKYRTTPWSGWDIGSIFGLHSRLYFPGLGRHHVLRIDNDWQQKERGGLYSTQGTFNSYRYFSDFAKFPRGVDKMINDQLYSLKVDYMLPLFNPDINLPGVMYLKRIKLNVFYDYSRVNARLQYSDSGQWIKNTQNISSLGAEARAELHPFRFVFPINVGYRCAYLPDTKKHYSEVLFSLGISSLIVNN